MVAKYSKKVEDSDETATWISRSWSHVAEAHLPALKSLCNVEVAAICDKRESVAEELALKLGVKTVFRRLDGNAKQRRTRYYRHMHSN